MLVWPSVLEAPGSAVEAGQSAVAAQMRAELGAWDRLVSAFGAESLEGRRVYSMLCILSRPFAPCACMARNIQLSNSASQHVSVKKPRPPGQSEEMSSNYDVF